MKDLNNALTLTKTIHKLSKTLPHGETRRELKRLASETNKSLQVVYKNVKQKDQEKLIHERLYADLLHGELTDREANAARLVERQRILCESIGVEALSAHERASLTMKNVENELRALTNYRAFSAGTRQLATRYAR